MKPRNLTGSEYGIIPTSVATGCIIYFGRWDTIHSLEGNNKDARTVATCASFLEQYRAVVVCKTQPGMGHGTGARLASFQIMFVTSTPWLVSFGSASLANAWIGDTKRLRSRAQSWAYVAIQAVLFPDGKVVERSKLSYCAQCFEECYCSSECQKAAWPLHKERCIAVGEAAEDWKCSFRLVSGDKSWDAEEFLRQTKYHG